MAWRFKASKYKNAAPKLLKREEWILDISARDLGLSCSNYITASSAYMTFNTDTGAGGNIGILPLSSTGKFGHSLPLLLAHGDFVSDFSFSPFDDYLLATGSSDCMVKIWSLPDIESLESEIGSIEAISTFPVQESRIDTLAWNPIAEGILAFSSQNLVKVFDVAHCKECYVLSEHKDQVQSISWKGDGSLLASSCRDKILRIFDPRSQKVVQEGKGPQNVKDSRAYWLGNNDQLLTSGFDISRNREVRLFDTRNLNSSLRCLSLDTSTGILMPLFDEDTNMLFLIGKGDTSLRYIEITDKDPYFIENSVDRTEQVKGAALVPKKALDVMEGEVNRLLLLTSNSVIPTPYIVPRKSYRDFHDDLFPNTASGEPVLTADAWLGGQNGQVTKISLDPAKKANIGPRRGKLLQTRGDSPEKSRPSHSPSPEVSTDSGINSSRSTPEQTIKEDNYITPIMKPKPSAKLTVVEKPNIDAKATDRSEGGATIKTSSEDSGEQQSHPISKPTKKFTGVRQSKFRHLKGKTLHRNNHIENVRNISKTIPGESDMFHANQHRCVVPLEGPGGLLLVLELNKPGRLPDTGIPTVQNGSKVCDFVWDPFDDYRLVVACDDAKIRIWQIPEDGLVESLSEPEFYLKGHTEKIYFVKFHPSAKNVLVSASYDMTVKLWDLEDGSEQNSIELPDQLFCAEWSPCGQKLATVCKDGLIRIFDPRMSTEPLQEGPSPGGTRGSRVVWVLNGRYLLVSGFDRSSHKVLCLYNAVNLQSAPTVFELEASPTILVPYYDEDSSTVFLHARGEHTIYTFEVSEDEPYIFPLSHYKADGLHQSVSFLPKFLCDVREVEFATAWRLTNSTVEPISFTVPRVKMEYFQDDLFPDTRLTWKPNLTSSEWFSGRNKEPKMMSLRPSDMKLLSEAPVVAPKPKKYESYNIETYKTDDQKKEELMSAMVNKLDLKETPLPQDLEDGVDSDEWDD